jgi:hypothetical protein
MSSSAADPDVKCSCKLRCSLQGSCSNNPLRQLDHTLANNPYVRLRALLKSCQTDSLQQPILPPAVFSERDRPGIGFLDLPAELRNRILKLVLLTKKILYMSLDPTLRSFSQSNMWGSRNRFALLSTCRQIYHEASPLAYGDNFFCIVHSVHFGLHIPQAPGMPFDKIHYLTLTAPNFVEPCTYYLGHTWAHWLQDASCITQRFPNLKRLDLYTHSDDLNDMCDRDEFWQEIFPDPDVPLEMGAEHIAEIVARLNRIKGIRMPDCVRIKEECPTIGHEAGLEALNMALMLSSGRHVSDEDKMALSPSWRDATD